LAARLLFALDESLRVSCFTGLPNAIVVFPPAQRSHPAYRAGAAGLHRGSASAHADLTNHLVPALLAWPRCTASSSDREAWLAEALLLTIPFRYSSRWSTRLLGEPTPAVSGKPLVLRHARLGLHPSTGPGLFPPGAGRRELGACFAPHQRAVGVLAPHLTRVVTISSFISVLLHCHAVFFPACGFGSAHSEQLPIIVGMVLSGTVAQL